MRSSGFGTASMAVALMLASLGGVAQTDPFGLLRPEPAEPRPEEIKELGKRQRKIYSRVLRETGDREAARTAALEAGA